MTGPEQGGNILLDLVDNIGAFRLDADVLQPGYAQFVQTKQPPSVSVSAGKYVMGSPMMASPGAPESALALTQAK